MAFPNALSFYSGFQELRQGSKFRIGIKNDSASSLKLIARGSRFWFEFKVDNNLSLSWCAAITE